MLTVLAGVLLGVGTQTGVSLPHVLPADEGLARGGGSQDAARAGATDPADTPPEGTVLSARSGASQPEPGDDGAGGETDAEETSPEEAGGSGPPEEPPPGSEEPLNVLILGVDKRPSEGEGASGRSDTIMIAQVSPGSGRVELLSVPRDLLVEVEPGVEGRINSAYTYGGVEGAKAVMEDLTGVPIDAHAIVDFQGFEDVIDALGGVTVDVGQPIRLGIEGRRVYIPAGRQELGGLEALAFARYRGTPGGDLDRIERQQKLLAALRSEMLRWNAFTKLPAMLRIADENVDTDLGPGQAFSLGRALIQHSGEGDLRAVQLKGSPATLSDGAQVLLPDAEANAEILQDFRE